MSRTSPDFVKIYDDTSGAGGEAGPAAEEVLDLVLRHIGPADFRGAGAVEIYIMIVIIGVDDVAVRVRMPSGSERKLPGVSRSGVSASSSNISWNWA